MEDEFNSILDEELQELWFSQTLDKIEDFDGYIEEYTPITEELLIDISGRSEDIADILNRG